MSAGMLSRRPSKRTPAEYRRIGCLESGAVAEYVETGRFDVLEDPHAPQPGKPELPAKPPVNGVADRTAGLKEFPRALCCFLERGAPLQGDPTAIEIGFPRERPGARLIRQVEPPTAPVDRQILPEIR